MKKVYKSSQDTGAPLSGACEVNGLVFLSGQIHMVSDHLAGDTIEERFDIIISNIKNLLEKAGLTLDDIIRVQLYLTDLKDLSNLNKIYLHYFKHPLPVRTAIEVNALPLGASLEIDVVAVRN